MQWNVQAQADTKHLIPPEKPETKEIPSSGKFGEGLGLVSLMVLPYHIHHSGTCGAAQQISQNICL